MDYKKKYLKYKLKYLTAKKLSGGSSEKSVVGHKRTIEQVRVENFYNAIRDNDVETIKEFLNQDKTLVNTPDNDGNTALMTAAEHGHNAVVNTLLERGAAGANINAQNKKGATALMFAANYGHSETVAALLAALPAGGAGIDIQNNKGYTALIMACITGHGRVVSTLLDHGANTNAQNHTNETALMVVAKERNNELLDILYNQNIKPNSILQDTQERTALISAIGRSLRSARLQNYQISCNDLSFINKLIRLSSRFGEGAESLENLLDISDVNNFRAEDYVNLWEAQLTAMGPNPHVVHRLGINFNPAEGNMPFTDGTSNLTCI